MSSSLPQTAPVDLVVLGPPGTHPQPGKTLARYDRNLSIVYSRSSSQLVTCGTVPNPSLAVPKDSRVPRSAEVTILLPNESTGDRRWTRAGTRAIINAHQTGINYLEESDTSSDSSSSDGENGVSKPYEKKRKRCRRQLLMGSHRGSRGPKDSNRGVGMSSVGEENMERDDWDGGVQMECEVGDVEPQSPFFIFPSPRTPPPPPGKPTNTSLTGVCTVYEDLNLLQKPISETMKLQEAVDRGRVSSTWRGRPGTSLRPCAINITSLSHHVVQRHLLNKQKSSLVLSGRYRRDSTSSEASTSTSNSSTSVSMLGNEPSRLASSISSQTGSKNFRSPVVGSLLKLTPQRRRLGSGKMPVARRSFPFSKPPSTPNVPRTVSPTTNQSKQAGFRAVPVDWSPDEDFKDNPSPSIIVSPVVPPGTSVSVKKEKKSAENSSLKSISPANFLKRSPGSKPTFSKDVSLHQPKSVDTPVTQAEGSSSVGKERPSPRKKSPFKTTAHSMTEGGTNSEKGTQYFTVRVLPALKLMILMDLFISFHLLCINTQFLML